MLKLINLIVFGKQTIILSLMPATRSTKVPGGTTSMITQKQFEISAHQTRAHFSTLCQLISGQEKMAPFINIVDVWLLVRIVKS